MSHEARAATHITREGFRTGDGETSIIIPANTMFEYVKSDFGISYPKVVTVGQTDITLGQGEKIIGKDEKLEHAIIWPTIVAIQD
jgi:hypothetical protein